MTARSRNNTVRLLVLAGALGMLLWLCAGIGQSRRHAIRRALASGEIGGLTEKETTQLSQLIARLAATAGIEGVRLNQSPRLGALDVYTTKEILGAVTGCRRGNAVYDAELDAIYLDLTLVKPALPLGSRWSGRQFLLAFVVLHEMGHRQLHGHSGGMFDDHLPGQDPVKVGLELEADAFALDKLKVFYAEDLRHGGRYVGIDHRTPVGLFGEALSDDSRLWSDLASLGFNLVVDTLQVQEGEFSAIHRDAAHPMLASRLRRLVGVAHRLKECGPTVRAYLSLARAILDRIEAAGQNPICELRLPCDAVDVVVRSRTLWITGEDGTVISVSVDGLMQRLNEGPYAQLTLERLDHLPRAPVEGSIVAGWPVGGSRFWILERSGVLHRWTDGAWRRRDLGRRIAPKISRSTKRVWLAGKETDAVACVIAGDLLRRETLTLLSLSRRAIANRAVADIERDVAAVLKVQGCEVEIMQSHDHALYGEIRSTAEALLVGVAVIEPRTLQVSRVHRFDPRAMPESVDRVVVLGSSPKSGRQFAFVAPDYESGSLGWAVWTATAGAAPVKRGAATWLADYINDPLGGDPVGLGPLKRGYDPDVRSVEVVDSKRIIVNTFGDSAMLVDLSKQRTRTVAHPGGIRLSIGDGFVAALPSYGAAVSNRCYIVRLR